MPRPHRYYDENHLHYLTTSTYRRASIFDSKRFKRHFVATLGELRAELGFRIVGYVLMPEHFHLLLWPSAAANPSQTMQKRGSAESCFLRLCGLKSDSGAGVGGQLHTVYRENAVPGPGFQQGSRIFPRARPRPIFRPPDQSRLDRVVMDVSHLLVILFNGTQGAVKEPPLPKQAGGVTPAVNA